MTKLRIGIAGGGVGGLSAGIALRQQGHDVTVFEQASQFSRVGADINLTPNVVRAIDGLGAGATIRRLGARPTFRISRDWDTGRETSRLGMADEAERLYGAPQVTIHRADIIAALAEQFPIEHIRFGQRIQSLTQSDAGVVLRFADGGSETFDVVVGADGSFYFKGESDRSIWLSPHDEIDCEPCDAAPEELDVALAQRQPADQQAHGYAANDIGGERGIGKGAGGHRANPAAPQHAGNIARPRAKPAAKGDKEAAAAFAAELRGQGLDVDAVQATIQSCRSPRSRTQPSPWRSSPRPSSPRP